MESIFKTGTKNTYFKGFFTLRDKSENWARPINFPTVFIAYGSAVKSGNWRSCTGINTPQYVINNYFNGKEGNLKKFWDSVRALEHITWEDVLKQREDIILLVEIANNELNKLITHN